MQNVSFGKLVFGGIMFVMLLLVVIGSFFVVDVGEVGVRINSITGETKSFSQGTYFKLPMIHSIADYDVKTQMQAIQLDCASKDLQSVKALVVLNFRPDYTKVNDIHVKIGQDYFTKVISPAVAEITKSAISKLPVESIIAERENLRNTIEEKLRVKFSSYSIIIENVNLTDVQFSPEFNRVVEEKQIEEQKVKTFEYQKKQAQEQKQTTILNAEGEAVRLKLLRDSISATVIQSEWIKKWNGVVPTTMITSGKEGGSNFFMTLSNDK